MENRYICIHGHFYQPPRENPWLEAIEVQDSAYPFRDWNERITAECYSPNAAARILKDNKTVTSIVNNYSKINFNFGPTLLSWMEKYAPEVYNKILEADKLGMENFSGHGTAIAQVYNHMIMPLANKNDKETQVIWGIEDFKARFGRMPEGIWLAETAVDTETLEVLAEQNIKYTILAPHQAGSVKKIKDADWLNVEGGKVDPKRAYICYLPSGKSINLFFYDGTISQELAFGNLMKSGENLAGKLLSAFNDSEEPQLEHIATDGETYGHHSKNGDMALSYCIDYIESNNLAKITNYGEFLEKFPPKWEAKIIENTSWSCAHGVERWRSNCGCNSGREGWTQEWRAPLREALDSLREQLIPLYEDLAGPYIKDVHALRNYYIEVILDRNPENIDNFFKKYCRKDLTKDDKIKLLKLLEMQRHAMLMYTSCGWFFDEISGIETVQVIMYAARAIQLANELTGKDYETEFVKKLESTKSNIPEVGNGAMAYKNYVKPAIIDLMKVTAHYAVSSLFEHFEDDSIIFSYEVFKERFDLLEAGKSKMAIGRVLMRSRVTYEESKLSFAFIHLGDHNLNGGVRESFDDERYEKMLNDFKEAFTQLSIAEIIFLIDKHFHSHSYTLQSLFKDESRKVFNRIMESSLNNIEGEFRQIYENHYPLMIAMKLNQMPIPNSIITAAEYVLNKDIVRKFSSPEPINIDRLKNLKEEVKKWDVKLDKPLIAYNGSNRINILMNKLLEDSKNLDILNEIEASINTLNELNIELDVWEAQNIFFIISNELYPELKRKVEKNDEEAIVLMNRYKTLESNLQVYVE